jgi:hypothetical protein
LGFESSRKKTADRRERDGHHPAIETLEQREMLSGTVSTSHSAAIGGNVSAVESGKTPSLAASAARRRRRSHTSGFLFAFYGYAGGGPAGLGFGNEWLRNLANDAGVATHSKVEILPEETGGPTALADLFKALDTNHNKTIQPSEIRAATVRVVGYSLGGIEAANFTRSLDAVGKRVQGYKLDAAIPIETLVTIDPVNYPINFDPLKHTDGPASNVRNFYNYYESGKSNGKSTLALFNYASGKSAGSASYNESSFPIVGYLHGDSLDSSALATTQIDVNSGTFANTPIRHALGEGSDIDGQVIGKNVDHTTMPFYAYPMALPDLL